MALINLSVCVVLLHQFASAAVLLKASTPTNPVDDGPVLALQCQFWNLEPSHIVTISRDVKAGSESLAWNGNLPSNSDSRIFLAQREQGDSSVIYLLSLLTANKEDVGNYSCQVLSNSKGQVTQIAADNVQIDVRYFPVDSNPACTPTDEITVTAGSQVSLNCSSVAGNPHVSVSWQETGGYSNRDVVEVTGSSKEVAYSQLSFVTKPSDTNSVFVCQVSSIWFPDLTKTCYVGPLVVVGTLPFLTTGDGVKSSPIVGQPTLSSFTTNSMLANDITSQDPSCSPCSSTTLISIFPWVVTFIVGTLASFIFFVVDISIYITIGKARKDLESKQAEIRLPEVIYGDNGAYIRAVASLTVPGVQEFHFPHFFLKF